MRLHAASIRSCDASFSGRETTLSGSVRASAMRPSVHLRCIPPPIVTCIAGQCRAMGPTLQRQNGRDGGDAVIADVIRQAAEVRYAEELAVLREADHWPRPPGWHLSPRMVETFIVGSRAPSTRPEWRSVSITPK